MNSTGIAFESPGLAIDRLCRRHGLKKGWVARELQITPSHLSRLISGDRLITPEMAQRLATMFGVPAATFLDAPAPAEGITLREEH
jgi:plasmid maintenance system antidote protein VapI